MPTLVEDLLANCLWEILDSVCNVNKWRLDILLIVLFAFLSCLRWKWDKLETHVKLNALSLWIFLVAVCFFLADPSPHLVVTIGNSTWILLNPFSAGAKWFYAVGAEYLKINYFTNVASFWLCMGRRVISTRWTWRKSREWDERGRERELAVK